MGNDQEQKNSAAQDGLDALLNLLYPETIYRFNQAMVSLWRDRDLEHIGNEKVAIFITPYFSSHSRTFHWVNIDPALWTRNGISIADFQPLFDHPDLDAFINELPDGTFYQQAKQDIKALKTDPTCRDPEKLKRILLALYSGHHNPARRHIEGVFIRLLETIGQTECDRDTLNCLRGELSGIEDPVCNDDVFYWFEMDECIPPALKRYEYVGPHEYVSCDDEKLRDDINDEIRGSRKSGPNGESIEFSLYTTLLGGRGSFKNELYASPHVCLIPLYDHWRRGKGYGGIKAVLMSFFKNEKDRETWLAKKYKDLPEGLATIASEISGSAQTMAISQPIKAPYDLVSHFLKILVYVQDWESATVVDKNTKKTLYRYRRGQETDKKIKYEWRREAVSEPEQTFNDKEDIEQHGSAMFMWWTTDLWFSDLIPGLRDDESARFGHLEICFEFPKASRIPVKNRSERKWLRQAYIRQQLSLMQRLIPKVQTRRAALRSAVSAIMGRNMSHNIGSHVLARYSSEIKKDLTQTATDAVDHRSDFLAYLQRRMDFIAEISTSESSHWSQSLSLREQVMRLNYGSQENKYTLVDNDKGDPILLKYITGKESLRASVEYGLSSRLQADKSPAQELTDQDILFACPGGEVGVHALYIILENVLRNSARHGNGSAPEVAIRVVAEEDHKREMIKLTIIDPRSKLTKGGLSLLDESKDVIKELKMALKAPFLDSSGLPDPRNWGAREMQICAHYLLTRPLSELEGENTSDVLTPEPYEFGKDEYCLSYIMHMMKPKNILILCSDEPKLEQPHPQGVKMLSFAAASKEPPSALRGYDFLVSEDGGEISPNLDGRLSLRRVTMSTIEITQLLKMSPELMLTTLHQKLASRYQTLGLRDKYWQQTPIVSIVGWDDGTAASVYANAAGFPSHIDTVRSDGNGFDPWPNEIGNLNEPCQANQRSEMLGVAWLDHANDARFHIAPDGFPASPYFAGAAVPCEPRRGIERYSRWIAVEPMWGDSPQTALLRRIKACEALEEDHRRDLAELVCAALPRVIVLDERVQSRRFEKVRAVSLYKYWPHVGIWTPFKAGDVQDDRCDEPGLAFIGKLATPPCDLDQPDFDAIKEFLKRPSPIAGQGDADFLVIHLTILEKLKASYKETDKASMDDVLAALIKDTRAANAKRIVVTGRGVPSQLRHNHNGHGETNGDTLTARFIPISALLEYLVQRPSKLGLMRVLWSA